MSRTRTITITLGSLAAGAMLATGVTGLAVAADSTPDDAASTATPSAATAERMGSTGGWMHHGPGGDGREMRGGLHGDAVHGETVVKAEDGTFSTVQMIRGTVTAVSADSISVKAEDGYSATFAVTVDTEVRTGVPTRPTDGTQPTAPTAGSIGDVTIGDVAMVRGTGAASAAVADHIHAMTAAEAAQLEQDRTARHAARQAS
jgi:hypothetical protein